MDPAPSTPTAPTPRETRRVALATLIGTSIEWFDFFVYGAAAALVFGELFFPTANRSPAPCSRCPRSASGSSRARSAG